MTGNTLDGYEINKFDTTQAKTALTIRTRIKMINKNKILARCPINRLAKVPTDCPLCLTESANVPKSCTPRSEEHTSELQSRFDLVCRLLLEKKHHQLLN